MTTILDSFMMDGNKEKTMNRIKLSGSFISIPSFSLFNVTKHDIRFISCSDEILPHTYASILHSSIEYEYLMSIKLSRIKVKQNIALEKFINKLIKLIFIKNQCFYMGKHVMFFLEFELLFSWNGL